MVRIKQRARKETDPNWSKKREQTHPQAIAEPKTHEGAAARNQTENGSVGTKKDNLTVIWGSREKTKECLILKINVLPCCLQFFFLSFICHFTVYHPSEDEEEWHVCSQNGCKIWSHPFNPGVNCSKLCISRMFSYRYILVSVEMMEIPAPMDLLPFGTHIMVPTWWWPHQCLLDLEWYWSPPKKPLRYEIVVSPRQAIGSGISLSGLLTSLLKISLGVQFRPLVPLQLRGGSLLSMATFLKVCPR